MVCKQNASRFITVIAITMFILLPAPSSSQIAGYDVLNMDFSARSSGMGGAFVSINGDPYMLFYNPAGLAGSGQKTAGITYLNHVLDINSGNFLYLTNRGQKKLGLGVNYINYGDFEGRDELGNDTGTFGAQDIVFTGGLARKYSDNIFAGAAVKVVYSKIENYSSSAFAVDAGIIYHVPVHMLNIGLAIANAGFVASAYDNTKGDLPVVLKSGISKQLAHLPLLWSIEYRRFLDGRNQFVGGGEFSFSDSFKGRLGYNSYAPDQKIGDEGGTLSGISFGFGLYWKKYIIDYAFTSMGVIGNLNNLTVKISL